MLDVFFVAPLLGALIGLSLALTGAGGGILAVPALVFGLHLSVSRAAPVGLMAVGLAAAAGAGVGLKQGLVRYRAAAVIGGAGMLAAPFGMALSRVLPAATMMIAFAAVLAAVAVRAFRRTLGASRTTAAKISPPPCVRSPSDGRFVWTTTCVRCLAATGLSAGVLSGLLGVGGGFVIVPSLTRYSDLEMDGVVNTSLAVIALVSVSGVASAAMQADVDWGAAVPFSVGAMTALLCGQRLARRWSGATLQRSFAVLCALVAASLLVRGLRTH